jgi:hypothetical protein
MTAASKLLMNPPAAGGFTPADLTSLVAWYDMSDASTITSSSGAVSQVDDKSGQGNHVTQATAANKPTTGTVTLNGLNVLAFDGSDWLSRAAIPLSTSSFFIYAVARTELNSVRRVYMSPGNNSYVAPTHKGSSAGFGFLIGGIKWVEMSGVPLDTWYRQRLSRSSGTITNYKNGTAVQTSTTTPLALSGSFWLGGDNAAKQRCDLAEVVVCNADQSAGDAANLESFMSTKWGI